MLKNKTNGKIYIGQTTRSIHRRLQEHEIGVSRNCNAIYNAIKFHGWENFKKDWYECPDEDLNFDEELLVREMGTLSPDGYNLREGGGNNGKMSTESKQKMSESRLGENNHMYGRTGEKNHRFGKTHSKESKQKISEARLGHDVSEETRQKISEAQIGIPKSKETRQKQSESKMGDKNYRSRRVYQYDLDGIFVDSFGSAGEAERYLEKNGSSIRGCARGERKTAYKFKWSYVKV